MSSRLSIAIKDAQPLIPSRSTIFSLPGELRNQIYDLTLGAQPQRTPLNSFHLNRPDPYVALLQTCSQLYSETRSYLVEQKPAYIPITAGMDYSYGAPSDSYGLSRATKDTIAASLTDFMNVEFHLHVDLLPGQERYSVYEVLSSLESAITQFQPRSWDLYMKHDMGNRKATVHLDHLLSLWPKMYAGQNCVPVGALKALVDVLARDKMTNWEIRYYVPTGQANSTVVYGNSSEDVAEDVRDGELAQLRYYAKLSGHDSITVVAEMYGEEKEWEYGEKSGAITRKRKPATEFWPNMHFDPDRFDVSKREHLVKTFPGKFSPSSHPPEALLIVFVERMPLEFFDNEAIIATQANRNERKHWMESLERRDRTRREGEFCDTLERSRQGPNAVGRAEDED
jgi:hypothetical protein